MKFLPVLLSVRWGLLLLEKRQFGTGLFPEFYFAENELDCSFSFSMRATIRQEEQKNER